MRKINSRPKRWERDCTPWCSQIVYSLVHARSLFSSTSAHMHWILLTFWLLPSLKAHVSGLELSCFQILLRGSEDGGGVLVERGGAAGGGGCVLACICSASLFGDASCEEKHATNGFLCAFAVYFFLYISSLIILLPRRLQHSASPVLGESCWYCATSLRIGCACVQVLLLSPCFYKIDEFMRQNAYLQQCFYFLRLEAGCLCHLRCKE